jgi:hypothetical protein
VSSPTLILSNPPHGLVDAKRAAPLLELLPVELVLKSHYPIPEIWQSRDDASDAEAAVAALRAAGLAAKSVPAADLGALPPQAQVEAFTFADDGLHLALDDQDLVAPYDLPIIAVACSPRDGGEEAQRGPGERTSVAMRAHVEADGAGAWGVFVDLYANAGGTVVRCGVSATNTSFDSIPNTSLAGPAGRLSRFLQECEGRFRRLVIDRRLMHLQLRRRNLPPPTGVQRKGFAFGTPALQALLQRIAPTVPSMSQCELSSRLVYLTQR